MYSMSSSGFGPGKLTVLKAFTIIYLAGLFVTTSRFMIRSVKIDSYEQININNELKLTERTLEVCFHIVVLLRIHEPKNYEATATGSASISVFLTSTLRRG